MNSFTIDALHRLEPLEKTNEKVLTHIVQEIHAYKELVTTGVGKSAILSTYLADLMASLGVNSHHIDPNGLGHGLGGRFTSRACVVALSYSGESEEVAKLLRRAPHKAKVFLLSSSSQGNLASYAHEVLLVPRCREQFAQLPTTSFQLMSLLCGQISTRYAEFIGEENASDIFYDGHPSGAIGRNASNALGQGVWAR